MKAGRGTRLLWRRGGVLGVLVALGLAAALSLAAGPKTRLASRTSGGDPAANQTDATAISGNGKAAALQSNAANLPGAGDDVVQVYVRDLDADKLKLASRTSAGDAGNGNSSDPWLSASGKLVSFTSSADNLPAGTGDQQIFVHDIDAKETELVSKTSQGDPASGAASSSSLSTSGRMVAFSSGANNLPDAMSVGFGAYVHDRKTGETDLGSRDDEGDPVDLIGSAQISPDGKHLAFVAEDADLPGGDGSTNRVYVRNLATGNVTLVSKNTGGDAAEGSCDYPSLSADGSVVVFICEATNMPGGDGVTSLVYVRDVAEGTTRLASRNADGDPAEDACYDPFVSANGRAATFYTDSENLPGTDGEEDVYIYKTGSGKAKPVSRNSAGDLADDDAEAYPPTLSEDGSHVVFRTSATNFPGTNDGVYTQLFVRGPLD